MKPVVDWPDVEAASQTYLGQALEGVFDDPVYLGVTLPKDWTPREGATWALVADDGGVTEYPVRRTTTLRVTVYCGSATLAKSVANAIQSRLLAHPGDESIRNIHEGTDPLPAVDADSHADLCSFTVRVELKPTLVG